MDVLVNFLRPHPMHCIGAIYCYRFCTQRGLSVCVGHRDVSCRDGWTNWDALLGGWIGWAQGTMYIGWGSRSPTGMGKFGEMSGPLKRIESLCCGACSKMDNWFLNNVMTADYITPIWSRSHYIVPVKNPPPLQFAFHQNSFATCI